MLLLALEARAGLGVVLRVPVLALLLLLLLLVELEGWERWSEPPIMASCLPLGQQGGGLPAQDTPPCPQRSGRRGDMASVTLATVPRP